MTDYVNLELLGKKVSFPASPAEAVLERVAKPFSQYDYLVRLVCPEFTSLCPVTGQPDFAHIVIDYAPDGWLVESKALKLFLQSFRNHGDFHEGCSRCPVGPCLRPSPDRGHRAEMDKNFRLLVPARRHPD